MKPGKSINMLNGPILPSVIRYTLPIMATGLLQLLFNTADLIVVGQFCGSNSIAAVGATSSLIQLMVNLFLGLSVGAGVCVAQDLGAKREREVQCAVHTAILLALVSGVVLTVIGFFFLKECLVLMGTPASVLPLSTVYIKYYFLGVTGSLVYNFGAAVMRAAGDTKTPLYYLIVAGVINVVLNVFFVAVLGMNVDGVAIATAISQTVSAALILYSLARRTDACRLQLKHLRFHKAQLLKTLQIGVPAGLQSAMFSISNVLIQSSINSFGETVVAGNSAAMSLEGFVYVCINAFSQTSLNFIGQNLGAGKFDRIKKIYRTCMACVTVVGVVLGALFYFCGNALLRIYITDSEQAIRFGLDRMLFICLPYFLCGIMDTTTGAIRGMGCSLAPMIITVLGVCVLRVVLIFAVFTLPAYHTTQTVYASYPISWAVTFLALFVLYLWVQRRVQQRQLKIA